MNSVEAKKGFKTFIILASGILTIFGAYKGIPAGYKHFIEAEKETGVEELKIESLTPTSITVSWQTAKEGVGFVQYGTNPNQLERTAPETSRKSNHKITIEGLRPQTTYYYKIGMDGRVLRDTPYQFTTPAE